MMKKLLFLLLLLLARFISIGQSLEDMRAIKSKTKDPFIKPESLDRILIDLHAYENSPIPGQDTLLLEIYTNITSGYMANNRFRQAYAVFVKYLKYKEDLLTINKASVINAAVNAAAESERNDDTEKINLQYKVEQLKKENGSFESKLLTFKANFSLALIILSSIFALVLLGTAFREFNLRTKLNQNREKMKKLHGHAAIGNFEPGLQSVSNKSIGTIIQLSKELQIELKKIENFQPAKEINGIYSGIEKIIGKLNLKN